MNYFKIEFDIVKILRINLKNNITRRIQGANVKSGTKKEVKIDLLYFIPPPNAGVYKRFVSSGHNFYSIPFITNLVNRRCNNKFSKFHRPVITLNLKWARFSFIAIK